MQEWVGAYYVGTWDPEMKSELDSMPKSEIHPPCREADKYPEWSYCDVHETFYLFECPHCEAKVLGGEEVPIPRI